MNLKQIEYITVIAEEKNISRAAKRLKVTQSTLSQGLSNEEHSLGVILFNRSQKGLELTEAGKCYLKAAKEILQIRDNLHHDIRLFSPCAGKHYIIGISTQTGFDHFSSRYHQFKEMYPEVSVKAIEGNAGELLGGLNMNQYAMILTAVDSFETVRLPHQSLCKEEILLAAPGDFKKKILSKHGNLNMEFIKNENFILANPGTTMRMTTERLFTSLGYHPTVVCETGHILALVKMVSKGIGFAILPETLKIEMENVRWISFYPKIYRSQMAVYQEKYAGDEVLMNLIKLLQE